MRTLYFIFAFSWTFFFYCCTNNNRNGEQPITSPIAKASSLPKNQYTAPTGIPDFTIDRPFQADRSELKLKRAGILKKFSITNSPAGPTFDTLVDINYDGYRDYLIGYYGLAGTGYKYRITVYKYSKSKNEYVLDAKLSDLVNPSFFIPQFKITGFYIGLGDGSGEKLEWINNEWTVTKQFSVDNNGDSTVWEISHPLIRKTEKINKPFQMMPPDDILESTSYF